MTAREPTDPAPPAAACGSARMARIGRSWSSANCATRVCLDVLDHLLDGSPIGRIAGPAAMKLEGWQRLNAEYARQFGAETRA